MAYIVQLLSAITLDLLMGDPRWLPHPVRGIGKLCVFSERLTRAICSDLLIAGFLTAVIVPAGTIGCMFFLVKAGETVSPVLGVIVAVLLLYTAIALRDLLHHSNAVYRQLQPGGSLEKARMAVAMIVGRDTEKLSQAGVTRACIETVAENMVDGVTAPLFWSVAASFLAPLIGLSPIGCSVLGAYAYKSVNTMDSMIGYKNEQYLLFGRAAAKLDDAVNFLPSRISGLCIIVAAFFLKLDYREAARIFRRDRLRHSSPNAGHTEAATAGALGIRLGGPSYYFGRRVEKPYLGNDARPPVAEDIQRAHRLILAATTIFILLLVMLRFFISL